MHLHLPIDILGEFKKKTDPPHLEEDMSSYAS